MKKLFVTLFIIGIASTILPANAQELTDVVYLKNGSVIRGVVIEQIPNESIKIQTSDGNIFVYGLDEISRLTKEMNERQFVRQGAYRATSKSAITKTKGYYGAAEIGAAFGVDILKVNNLSVGIINGYQFNNYIAVGLGVGLNSYIGASGLGSSNMPIYLNVRSHFLKSNITPYASLNIGYNVGLGNMMNGFMLNPSIGVAFRVSNSNMLTLGVAYYLHNLWWGEVYYDGYENYISHYRTFANSLGIKLGITF